jgi:serine-type D-Ala-D-Ala carboxypeptidase (penicillin-binding protein 5/6)
MERRVIALIALLLALALLLIAPVLAFTPVGRRLVTTWPVTPTPTATHTPIPFTPTPLPTPVPVLTAKGTPPALSATASYLLDMDTGHVLDDVNGEKPLPMASTTKIMTALIAIQTGNLDQQITVQQDAINRVIENNGSNAGLAVGETLTLKDLLYGLLVPSGDDAAVAIADGLGGTTTNFVQRMNLFAYRLRLFQTHYTSPDGLTPDGQTNPDHYTTAADLTRLADYAMHIPLFAHIVQTKTYTIAATAQHSAHTWINTNTLLTTYTGMIGVKTGHTEEAGYCLVFAATHGKHHLLGVVLHSSSQEQRDTDARQLLDWGFALPMLPPSS